MAKGFTVQFNQHTEHQLSENWTEMNLKKKEANLHILAALISSASACFQVGLKQPNEDAM